MSDTTRPEHLTLEDVTVRFRVAGSRKRQLTAVNEVSLTLAPGEALGVVGESGCGKSTIARTVAGLATPTSGSVRLGATQLGRRRSPRFARRIQMVFQDPVSSLNPRMTVGAMLAEVLRAHRVVERSAIPARCEELMTQVGLPVEVLRQRPRNLSGGQRQRVGIARALAPQPEVLILDEAIASLDVSVQASVLDLLRGLRRELGVSMVFISHDLAAVRGLCSRVAVMYLGRIVEIGPVDEVLRHPAHPYTRALISAEPDLDAIRLPGLAGLQGEPPSAIDLPAGCAFRLRCPVARPACAEAVPLIDTALAHDQACFFPLTDTTGAAGAAALEGSTR